MTDHKPPKKDDRPEGDEAPLSGRVSSTLPPPPPSVGPVSSSPTWSPDTVRRILVVDDNVAVHGDFRKILCPAEPNHALDELESKLFGDARTTPPKLPFSIDVATQGREGHAMVLQALRLNDPYALAFVDMRMPPGWDGIETILHIQKDDPAIEIVICSAYSEYSWKEVIERLKRPNVQFLPKPFHSRDVLELAWGLTTKWLRQRRPAAPG